MKSDQELGLKLTLAATTVIDHNWPIITKGFKDILEKDLTDDAGAKAEFTMAVLSILLSSQDFVHLHHHVCSTLDELYPIAAGKFNEVLHFYIKAWQESKPPTARFVVPPIKFPQEALAIVFLDSIKWCATIVVNGVEIYNLFHLGYIGGNMLRVAIEAKKAFKKIKRKKL